MKPTKNSAKIYTTSSNGGINTSFSDTNQIISVTNNKAKSYEELAAKYRDEAKKYRDEAKEYAEQNSDVTMEDIFQMQNLLQSEIDTKQPLGDYALVSQLPVDVSELNNDAQYSTITELNNLLPAKEGAAGKFLKNDGTDLEWANMTPFSLFDIKRSDHILEGVEAFGWALQGTYTLSSHIDFYQKCLEEKNAGVVTQTTLGSNTITTYNHLNGHIYFNIADKDVVDAYYEQTGYAWFYGIDEANERIFLPRNSKISKSLAPYLNYNAGVAVTAPTNGAPFTAPFDGVFVCSFSINNNYDTRFNINGVNTQKYSDGSGVSGAVILPFFIPMKKGDVGYWNTNTNTLADYQGSFYPYAITEIETTPKFEYLYFCVGNTEQIEAAINVTEVTTSENDTLPLGYSLYQGKGTQPSAAWLASKGQWNNGNVYTTFYNYAINKIGEEFANGYIKNHTESYTDYDLVINQNNITFRLPLLDGSEDIPHKCIQQTGHLQLPDNNTNNLVFTAEKNCFVTLRVFGANAASTIVAKIECPLEGTYPVFTSSFVNIGQQESESFFVAAGSKLYLQNITSGASNKYNLTIVRAVGNGDLYFKVANAVQNLEFLDAGEVLDSLTNKVDTNANNFTKAGKMSIASLIALDFDNIISLTVGASGTFYNAPNIGCFQVMIQGNNTSNHHYAGFVAVDANGNDIAEISGTFYSSSGTSDGWVTTPILKKGQKIKFLYGAANVGALRFIPVKGVESGV